MQTKHTNQTGSWNFNLGKWSVKIFFEAVIVYLGIGHAK